MERLIVKAADSVVCSGNLMAKAVFTRAVMASATCLAPPDEMGRYYWTDVADMAREISRNLT